MATSYFGNRSTSGGESPFYKLKNIPLLNTTNMSNDNNGASGLPVFRSAVANNVFRTTSSDGFKLVTINSNGTETTVSSALTGTYLASSARVVSHLNTADQCLYILCKAGSLFQLVKMTDSAGTTSAIGSSFTPTTVANWPSNDTSIIRGATATMFVDGAGHLRIYCNGFYHQINRTTGAIVSQNNVVTIGAYNLKDTAYLSESGSIATSLLQGNAVSGDHSTFYRNVVSSTSGIIPSLRILDSYMYSGRVQASSNDAGYITLVDSDKVFIGSIVESTNTTPFGYFYRSDYDQFLQSVVDWYAGA